MREQQRRGLQDALLEADGFQDLPGKWQAAIVKGEENRPGRFTFDDPTSAERAVCRREARDLVLR
jgi:hypothetical protein